MLACAWPKDTIRCSISSLFYCVREGQCVSHTNEVRLTPSRVAIISFLYSSPSCRALSAASCDSCVAQIQICMCSHKCAKRLSRNGWRCSAGSVDGSGLASNLTASLHLIRCLPRASVPSKSGYAMNPQRCSQGVKTGMEG